VMLNIRGMSIVENLLSGVNRFGQGLTKKSAASVTSRLDCPVGWSLLKIFKKLFIQIICLARDKA